MNFKVRGRAVGRYIQHRKPESASSASSAPGATAARAATNTAHVSLGAVRRRKPTAIRGALIIIFILTFDARTVMLFLTFCHGVVSTEVYGKAGRLANTGITLTVILALKSSIFNKRISIEFADPGFTPLL
jgi:hypothetical protein